MKITIKQWRIPVAFFLLLLLTAPETSRADSAAARSAQENAQVLPAEPVLEELSPPKQYSRISGEILGQLRLRHFRKIDIDNAFSERFFQRLLSDLDENKNHFLKSDIDEFEVYRYELDNSLAKKDLMPGYIIFNRFRTRQVQRLNYMIERIEAGTGVMDFEENESLQIERKNLPWLQTMAELEDLWRKQVKNDVLNLKLGGETAEAEIEKTLLKRYKNRLNQVLKINEEDVFQVYIDALTHTFDPHTEYFSPHLWENFNIRMSLSLEGIGALLQQDSEYIKIVSLVPGGPADKDGRLKPGDRITGVGQGVDGEIEDVMGWRIEDVVNLIRGPKETVVRIKIIPTDARTEHQTQIVDVLRNTVKLEDQAARKQVLTLENAGVSHKIGVIDIPTFYIDFKGYQEGNPDYRSTTRDVRRLIEELIDAGVEGIIIDLRNNGGGALQEVSSLVGLFVPEGPTVQVKHANRQVSQIHNDESTFIYDGPLAVAVNRLSASASEIFAGAIQDYGRGIILGSRTFGKGTVQSLVKLSSGELKLTIAKFYRISGGSTQSRGISPDIKFPDVFDIQQIGESELPESLPWDTIEPVFYDHDPGINKALDRLNERHQARIDANADFIFTSALAGYLKQKQGETLISLNRDIRKKQKDQDETWRLNLENQRRKAKGQPMLEKLEEDPAEADPDMPFDHDKKDKEPDAFVTEGGWILLDWMELSRQNMNPQNLMTTRLADESFFSPGRSASDQ